MLKFVLNTVLQNKLEHTYFSLCLSCESGFGGAVVGHFRTLFESLTPSIFSRLTCERGYGLSHNARSRSPNAPPLPPADGSRDSEHSSYWSLMMSWFAPRCLKRPFLTNCCALFYILTFTFPFNNDLRTQSHWSEQHLVVLQQ